MSYSPPKMSSRSTHASGLAFIGQDAWERWSSLLLLALLLGALALVAADKNLGVTDAGLTTDAGAIWLALLGGISFLLLIVKLHLASQRRLLQEISSALAAAGTRADRMERFSFLDPETELLNRNYLDRLFGQASKWLNRSGNPVTIVLFELHQNELGAAMDYLPVEAARLLRANFRGSDYIMRIAQSQFLVLLPDTSDGQAHYALKRLVDKIDHWNLENEKLEIVLRHQEITCAPGASLWQSLEELEQKLRQMPAPDEPVPDSAMASQTGPESH